MAALLCVGVGVSCKSARRSQAAPDSLAADTTRWSDIVEQSLRAFARGDTQEALRLVAQAESLNSENPFLYEVRGYYHYTQGKDSLALAYYRKALEKGGKSPSLHYKIGSAYLMQRRWKDAYYHFIQSLAADSSNGEVWVALGLWAHLQGRFSEAAAYWKKALSFDSTHQKARAFLYDLYLNDFAQPETAKKYYLDPYWRYNRFDPLLNFQLGNYYLKKLQATPEDKAHLRERATYAFQAAQAYSQAILAHPAYAQAHYNRGYVYFLVHKYDRALEDFVRATELNPRDASAHFMAASLYERKGEYEKAKYHYKQSIAIRGTFPEAEEALRELEQKP
ncbi:MAG: tetratricopeptide repeat protein [Bacteroidia bacterium]|nr:tetratricopeptide repeat protein [Bacteroidia bacterium]MDW8056742.1 tetratricopeptide repeat protein [Bacteroidia bacterium]